MNLALILKQAVSCFGNRPALVEQDTHITYPELDAQSSRIASALVHLGIQPGEPVGICAPNSIQWVVSYFGILKAGAVAATFPNAARGAELRQLILEAKPRMIFTSPEHLSELQDLQTSGVLERIVCPDGDLDVSHLLAAGSDSFGVVDRDRDDACAILFTGGTTGIPKGAVLSHENILTSIQNVVFNERSRETDCALCFLPLNHVFGQIHILDATLLSGGCIELMPAFDMETILEMLSRGRITKLFAVPTVYARLLALPSLKETLGAVQYCFSAAASMAAEMVRQWMELTGLAIHEAYGMTESASMVTYNHYRRHVVGSVGTPVGTVEVHIRDMDGRILGVGETGEICIRGRNIMRGYLNRPEETQAVFWGDWFRSGDLGMLDENGYLYIVDRLKDMIITGGENVYPREVEDRLYGRPEIQECAVVGLPDPEWGERVTAFIVGRPGFTVDPQALKASLKSCLAPYKVPKEFRIVDALPKSPSGKILKRSLRDLQNR
ncbi:MAG: AMP-binding protein [Thermodesulfobacteriota bacterium]